MEPEPGGTLQAWVGGKVVNEEDKVEGEGDGKGDILPREWGGRGQGRGAGAPVVVLLPTHRSYLDFVLLSLLCMALRAAPGLGWLRVPHVAAAEGAFGGKGSLMHWILARLGAFFVRRGAGRPDPSLTQRIKNLGRLGKGSSGSNGGGPTIEGAGLEEETGSSCSS
ncbi:unnamed protein product, partial [Discosporangium mesarthrocarpum]